MPTLSIGRVNIWRIFSPAVWAATTTLPIRLMASCMMTAPIAETEYSNPMGRPMTASRLQWAGERRVFSLVNRMPSTLAKNHQVQSRPLSSWLTTVASAAPSTPMPTGTMSAQSSPMFIMLAPSKK